MLFGTDIDLESPLSQMDEPTRRATVEMMRDRYHRELAFYREPADSSSRAER